MRIYGYLVGLIAVVAFGALAGHSLRGEVENPSPPGGVEKADAEHELGRRAAGETATTEMARRTRAGLMALYDFRETTGDLVRDRSGMDPPLDLRISDPSSVRREAGSLEVLQGTLLATPEPAVRLFEAIRQSGEVTIEAWIRPAQLQQTGPARIVTLSKNGSERYFTLGQEGSRFIVRFRTTETGPNGTPSFDSAEGSVTTQLCHVVYTRDRTGQTRIYLNGQLSQQGHDAGSTQNWGEPHKLALANELSNDRAWRGTYHLVAVYSRDLLPWEVTQHFHAGPSGEQGTLADQEVDPGTHLFEAEIAPLLTRHCLECHDSVSKQGELDLSRREAALAGGESGKVLQPGNADESLVWQYVESDEMPQDRPPLSAREKQLLRQWIEAGATWSQEQIDPATYARGDEANGVWLQRLTVPEYIATVQSAVGVDVADEARRLLPRDLRADGFSNTAYNLNVDLKHVEAYAKLAEVIVQRMDVRAFAARFSPCQELNSDCLRPLITRMGKWMLRGPLEEHEVDALVNLSLTVASQGGNFEEAMQYVLQAMLQSPRFIYRIENQRGDGKPWPVNAYELASRLSYILWGAPPDQSLMRAADSGELYDRKMLDEQITRMLDDPRAISRSTQFIEEWLDLERLESLRPDPERFPQWDPQLAADMREETLAYFREVVWQQQRPLADLLNAQLTVVSPRLAQHYGLAPQGDGTRRYDLADHPARGGLLSQASVLTVGGDQASMVARGLFVLHDLLQGTVKDPPPCVDTTPVPSQPGLTQRMIAEARIANPACGGCHARFEPLAFGLERFDGIGAYHETDEHGNRLRDDGQILFPGQSDPVNYDSSAELMDLLAASDRVRRCITWKFTQFALGRPLTAADAPILDRIHQQAQQAGGTYPSLVRALVMSDLVQMTRTERETHR